LRKSVKILLVLLATVVILLLSAPLFLPDPLFSDAYSTVIYDRNGKLLGGRVADDEQWRFPESDSISGKFKKAIVLREDRNFYRHPGFNPVSIFKALVDNVKAGHVVRGGSTITMQVIRLSRHGKPRTVKEKLIELYLGIALEIKYSKEEILALYAAHAPFGGNVVGLEAASWRYFSHAPSGLSWGEAALLAVLPNAPSLMHPGKNRRLLKEKRDKLLDELCRENMIDSLTLIVSRMEQLPEKPQPLPQFAPQLLNYYERKAPGTAVVTTIDGNLQQYVTEIVETHHYRLAANEIHNAAVIVMKPETYEVLAYVGNTKNTDGKSHGNSVDMIRARRSTGSILKPLLYAAMMEDGMLMPDALVPDIPSYYENYHPENYDLTFEGAVPASQALSRSRNVPAVYMLRDYGGARFLRLMRKAGLTTFNKPADHYGLTLILGGGEATLWELTNMYAGMARTLLDYDKYYGKYTGREYDNPVIEMNQKKVSGTPEGTPDVPLHAGSVWLTYKALKNVKRPDSEQGWESFGASVDVAWKTGTSYGFRDAWAIGTTPDYIVGVWVGNADGEGRNGLTGTTVAAPVMFEVFNLLHATGRFYPPWDELKPFVVCSKSGCLASRHCPETDTVYAYVNGERSRQCPYHQLIFTDKEKSVRLTRNCASADEMTPVSWFVLPPVQEWYYRKVHPSYDPLPPYKPGCQPADENKVMEFIYPLPNTRIYVPVGADRKQRNIVFEISHRFPSRKVYWHLDNIYLGETKSIHQFGFIPEKGWHTLTVVDEEGNSCSVRFDVVNSR
jgi:penicillin-binding protein 1C